MPLLPISLHRQRRQADCLAACAAMLLDYWQIPASYDSLVQVLQIGQAGAPFRNLGNLERLGVSVRIEQGQLETLRALIENDQPPIVFVTTQELSYWSEATNHALVVAGLDDDFIYVNDPSLPDAPQIIDLAEFDLAWLEMDEFYALIQPKA